MTEATDALVTDIQDSIAILRFNRPAERNPLSVAVLVELKIVLDSLLPREEIKAIIFTGMGDVFASGADISELAVLDSESARGFSQRGQELFQTIANTRQITVAAINGYCMGGALDLALACDIRVASPSAIFGHPGARLGIITGWGGTQKLPRVIGKAPALEFFVTARRVTSQEAVSIGLISEVCEPVVECALKIVDSISK